MATFRRAQARAAHVGCPTLRFVKGAKLPNRPFSSAEKLRGVIPKARAFTSGPRDLARSSSNWPHDLSRSCRCSSSAVKVGLSSGTIARGVYSWA